MATAARTIPGQRLGWLEVGRGLAALAVVLAHFDRARGQGRPPLLNWFDLGSLGIYGVEFFFVLSGFIIYYVHRRDLSDPGAAPRYVWRRFVRVFPTYWIVLLLALIFNQTLQDPTYRYSLSPGFLIDQLLILPGGEPAIGPAWTLRHELLFYAVFAIAIVNLRIGAIVFFAWMAAALGTIILFGLPPAMVYDGRGIFLHHYNLDFIVGIAIAAATVHGRANALLAGMIVATVLVLVARGAGISPDLLTTIALKLVFGIVVIAAVIASQRGISAPRLGVALGAMSYSLYISHILVGGIVRGGLKRVLDWEAMPASAQVIVPACAAFAFAWALHRFAEAPLLGALQNKVGRRADVRPVVATIG